MPIRFRLAELLRSRQITPYRLGKDTGLALSTVYRMTRARPGVLKWDSLERLCDYLRVDPAQLIVRTGPKKRRR